MGDALSARVVVACACGEVYELKPDYAGRLLECPACRRVLRAGGLPAAARPPSPDVDPAFHRDVFLLDQRALRIRSEYEVSGEDGTPILYVERPTYPVRTVVAYLLGALIASFVSASVAPFLAGLGPEGTVLTAPLMLGVWLATFAVISMSARPVRHVTVYRDDSRRETVLVVRQDQRVAVLMRTYTIVTPAGDVLAVLRKLYVHNILRKRWYVDSPRVTGAPDDAPRRLAVALEDSVVLSLLRRVLGTFFGLLRTNFLIVAPDGAVIGEFHRRLTVFDRYRLDLTADPHGTLDRRVALALGIMLDTGERR